MPKEDNILYILIDGEISLRAISGEIFVKKVGGGTLELKNSEETPAKFSGRLQNGTLSKGKTFQDKDLELIENRKELLEIARCEDAKK